MPAPVKTIADFTVFNSATTQMAWVAADPRGGFSVAYSRLFSDAGSDDDTHFSVFNAFGQYATGNAISNLGSSIDEVNPSIAYLANGLIAMTWVEKPDASGENDIYYKVVDPVTAATIIARTLVAGGPGAQSDPAIAASTNGGFAIAWTDQNVAHGVVRAAVYQNVGSSPNIVSQVNQTAGSVDNGYPIRDVSIAGLADGGYVVGWTDESPLETRTRIMSATGTLGAEATLNPDGNSDFNIDMAMLADGRYVAVNFQAGASTAFGQFYSATNVADGVPFQIASNVDASTNQHIDVAGLQDGRFVVVWKNTSSDIRGRVFFSNGTPDGAEFVVNTTTTGSQIDPSIDVLADGRFVVTWTDFNLSPIGTQAAVFDPRESGVILDGTAQADTYVGSNFADQILASGGNDTVDGGAGGDTLRGGAGFDSLLGGAGDDTIFGEAGADRLFGGDNNDFLDGGFGIDSLFGDANNDTLFGGMGADSLDGGAGIDTVSFAGQNTGMTLVFNTTGAGNLFAGEPIGLDIFTGIENVDCGEMADDVGCDGAANVIRGFGGNDRVWGNGGNDTLIGGVNDDQLYGQADDDNLSGESGADLLEGGDNNDALDGGEGADTLRGGNGSDFITAGSGIDSIDGGDGSDTLNFSYSSFGMTLVMASINATTGQVFAGPEIGFDVFANIENIVGSTGSDSIGCDMAGNFIAGNDGNDSIWGGHGMDVLEGGIGNDMLFGQFDADILRGGDGADQLFGWVGNDTLTGGAGADSFMWTGPGEGLDQVLDYSFADGDVIDVVGDPSQCSFVQMGTDVLIRDSAGNNIFHLVGYNAASGLSIV